MAKVLNYEAQIEQGEVIQAWHVSQSVDAFTGVEDYDITLSGSFTLSGSAKIEPAQLLSTGQEYILTYNNTTGQIFKALSSSIQDNDNEVYRTGSSNDNIIPSKFGDNGANGTYAVVLGGSNNTASGASSFIGAGILNTASGACGFIGGGARNYINSSAASSSILGGFDNTTNYANTHIIGSNLTADKENYTFVNNLDVEGTVSASIFSGSFVGDGSGLTGLTADTDWYDGTTYLSSSKEIRVTGIISGSSKLTIGSSHSNTGTLSTIAGGTLNTASAACSFIGGGCLNNICSGEIFAVIGGGRQNRVDGDYSAVVGGYLNCTRGNCSFIGGGCSNDIFTGVCFGVIGGGHLNVIGENSRCSTIGGGYANTNCSNCGTIVGGRSGCIVNGGGNSIVGGKDNQICHGASQGLTGNSINGGNTNFITGSINSTIAGGSVNNICALLGNSNTIGGGAGNIINESSQYTTIAGGSFNTSSAVYSFIGGGERNYINSSAASSSILGGFDNTTNYANTHIIGSNLTADKENYTFVNNIYVTGSTSDNGILQLSRRESNPSSLEAGMIWHSGSAGAGCLYFSPDGSAVCQIAFV